MPSLLLLSPDHTHTHSQNIAWYNRVHVLVHLSCFEEETSQRWSQMQEYWNTAEIISSHKMFFDIFFPRTRHLVCTCHLTCVTHNCSLLGSFNLILCRSDCTYQTFCWWAQHISQPTVTFQSGSVESTQSRASWMIFSAGKAKELDWSTMDLMSPLHCTWMTRVLFMYNAFGKFSDPFKFSIFCYVSDSSWN